MAHRGDEMDAAEAAEARSDRGAARGLRAGGRRPAAGHTPPWRGARAEFAPGRDDVALSRGGAGGHFGGGFGGGGHPGGHPGGGGFGGPPAGWTFQRAGPFVLALPDGVPPGARAALAARVAEKGAAAAAAAGLLQVGGAFVPERLPPGVQAALAQAALDSAED
jgi:hypothetical protein